MRARPAPRGCGTMNVMRDADGRIEPSPELVRRKLRDCFPDPAAAAVAGSLLNAYRDNEAERVRLAVLMLSRGDVDRLRELMEKANQDYREVLVDAEYPGEIRTSPNAPTSELVAARDRDRERYEACLRYGGI